METGNFGGNRRRVVVVQGKEKRMSDRLAPEKVAQDFLTAFYKERTDRYIQTIKEKETSPEKREHQLACVELLKSIPDEEKLNGSVRYALLIYDYQVRPYLPWDSLGPIQKELGIDDNHFKVLLFVLKPT